MNSEYNVALKKLLNLFLAFEGKPRLNQDHEWRQLENYVDTLVRAGYSRKDIYHLLTDLHNSHEEGMSTECADALSNYTSALVGQVAVECIFRLPGELYDDDEHASYVRGMKWLWP